MVLLYNISIQAYTVLVRIASPFNKKAKYWVEGRRNIFNRIEQSLNENENIAWFHASSLGEFEQGRPVMEAFKLKYPNYKILLTFFSPSGYEVRKNYEGADYIFYLPVDSKRNALKFIKTVKPKVVFFVKYEFWFHYLNQLNKSKIPTYIFSSIFREKQLFFRWYGVWYRKMLAFFTKIFVQDLNSKQLLDKVNISNVEIGGDTRFDRVYALAKNAKPIKLIEEFAKDNFIVIAGSTWERDEEIIAEYAHKNQNIKWIIAPHEIHSAHIEKIVKIFKTPLLKLSEATIESVVDAKVLVVDSIGVLSSLYRYGNIAYIGGGFGKGIHNTLEAATYGMPVIFGPNYNRFREACDLIELSSGFSVSNYNEFELTIVKLINNDLLREESGKSALNYVNKMRGGTEKIISQLTVI